MRLPPKKMQCEGTLKKNIQENKKTWNFTFINSIVQVYWTGFSLFWPAVHPPHSGKCFSGFLSSNFLGVEVCEKSWQPVVGLPWGLQIQPGQPFLQQVFLEEEEERLEKGEAP
jgi:hypothetical protein